MKIDCGIIGLPNVGKSTLFSVLTSMSVKIANFPFCTIRPNISIIRVLDPRIFQLTNIVKSHKVTYGVIEFVDIAGLIKGAAHGEGLGDKTLEYIREVKILCHVIRCFDDDQIAHIAGSIDPNRDINIINTELILFDISQCEKYITFLQKNYKIIDTYIEQKLFLLNKCLINLNNGILLREVQFSSVEQIKVKKFNFLTFKPIMYVANISTKNKNNIYLNKLKNMFSSIENKLIVPCCALSLLSYDFNLKNNCNDHAFNIVKKQKDVLKNNIIENIFYMLNLCTFFTINMRMIRAWIDIDGITAIEAANRVHSDFKKGFIRVQVIKFDDFMLYKGENGVKKTGKIHFEGKNYYIKDGDILKFLFNTV